MYLTRENSAGTNPFTSGDLGAIEVDVASGSFGAAAVEASDISALADAVDTGHAVGTAAGNGYAVRIDITGSGLGAINDQGTTQLRVHFPLSGMGTVEDRVGFHDGDAGPAIPSGLRTLADHMGTASPFLDVSYTLPIDDNDGDGIPDASDDDDDNDGVADADDTASLDPDICEDKDADGCDDCSVGADDFGVLADNLPLDDGTDTDTDGMCDIGDEDDDGDGISDADELAGNTLGGVITEPLDPDTDGDGILDSWDRFPRADQDSNDVGVCGVANASIGADVIIGPMTCVAWTSIVTPGPVEVDSDDDVNGPGDLLLIAPTVSLGPGFVVEPNGKLTVISADPSEPPP